MSTPVGVKNYTESPTLLQYQSKIELGEDTNYTPFKKRQIPEIENNPSIPDALNSIFYQKNGKKMAKNLFNMYHKNQEQGKKPEIFLKL